MSWRPALAAAVAVAGCHDRRADSAPPAVAAATGGDCVATTYPTELDVPEASGAAWLPDAQRLLVVADSGHDGTYVEVDAAGAIVGRGRLPLGDAGDDVEGLARDGDQVWGLTSSGWMMAWRRAGDGYGLTAAFALDDTCGRTTVNCGANYEGLCLAPRPLADGCDGYAAAKATGELVCLHRGGPGFVLDRGKRYHVTGGGRLADCAIADDGTVWTGDNGFGLAQARQLAVGPDGARLLGEAHLGLGFPEVLAFGPDHVVYRFSDLGGSPSLATAFRCPAGLPKAGPDPAGG